MKRGDTAPPLTVRLSDGAAPVDLTGSTVRVLGRVGGNLVLDDSSPNLDEGSEGLVVHHWVAGETNFAGVMRVEVEVTWPGGFVQTWPPNDYLYVVIAADLGGSTP